jgi:site-specific DNA recombinase
MARADPARAGLTVRCAIYTRKSSEEGLEQEFNSLQAQREACEAFIDSQRHEGWVCQRAAYDDGGFSGATMDRPALQQLLADVKAGRVDTIVVYKIDRLTRSLADFAKIVEILDARGASFVSVTQQFNTTTSMGVRRDKAALSSGCEAHPAIRSSRKQPEQAWRRRNV